MKRNKMKKAKKLLATGLAASCITLGAAGNVLANPNGFYIGNTEYLMSDLTSSAVQSAANQALAGNYNNVILNLNGMSTNLGAFLGSLGQTSPTTNLFDSYAASNPAPKPEGTTVYNPANPSSPLPDTDSTSSLTVASVSPINITTAVGTAPVLPATVQATMSDGSTANVAVTWASVAASSYAAAGTFAVSGSVAYSSVAATANVTVSAGLAVSSVSAINVTTMAGTAPVLPATVTATMSDGTTQSVAVTWASVAASSYASAGTFTVSGTIANSTVTATATVTVNAAGLAAPTITATSTSNSSETLSGATDIAINSPITVKFSTAIDPATVIGQNFRITQAGVLVATAAPTLSTDGTTVTVTPVSNLTGGKAYQLAITGIKSKDDSLTLGSEVDTTFTTASADVVKAVGLNGLGTVSTKGYVTAADLNANQTPASTAADYLTVQFTTNNGGLDLTTVNSTNVTLEDVTSGTTVPAASVSLSATDTIKFTVGSSYNSGQLKANHQYSITVNGVNSISGTPVAESTSTFTITNSIAALTAQLADGTLLGTSIVTTGANEDDNVNGSLTSVYNADGTFAKPAIKIYVSEANTTLDATTLTSSNVVLTDTTKGVQVPITISFDSTNNRFSVVPNSALTADDQYTLYISNGVKDIYGNAITAQSFVFQTKSYAAPVVTATSVVAGASNVSLTNPITVTFSEKMNQLTFQYDSTDATQKALDASHSVVFEDNTATAGVPFNVTWDSTGTVATVTPVSALTANHSYTLTIGGYNSSTSTTLPVTDNDGNDLASNYVLTFATGQGDTIAPTVKSITDGSLTGTAITNSSTNVGTSDKLYIDFSKVMKTGTLVPANVKLYDATAGQFMTLPTTPAPAITTTTDSSGNTVAIVDLSIANNGNPIAGDHKYSLQLTPSITDNTSNLNALATEVDTTFVTSPAPTFTAATSDPSNTVTTVSQAAGDTSLTLKTPGNITSGHEVAVQLTNGSFFFTTLTNVSSTWTLGSALPNAVANGAVVYDLGSTSALVGSTVKNFDTGVSTTQPIALHVTGPSGDKVDLTTITGSTVTLNDASGNSVAATVSAVTDGGNGALLSVAPTSTLSANSTYTITLSGIKDQLGNIIKTSTLTFTTGVAPASTVLAVSSISPSATTNVPTNAKFTVTFNEPVQGLSTTPVAFDGNVSFTGATITGKYYISADGKTLTVVPDSLPAGNAVLTLNIADTVYPVGDDASHDYAMSKPYTFTFQTLANAPATVANVYNGSSTPVGISNSVYTLTSISSPITIGYANGSNPSTLNDANATVTMENMTTGVNVPLGTLSLVNEAGTDDAIQFAPIVSMTNGDSYSITINGLTDAYGNAVASKTIYVMAPASSSAATGVVASNAITTSGVTAVTGVQGVSTLTLTGPATTTGTATVAIGSDSQTVTFTSGDSATVDAAAIATAFAGDTNYTVTSSGANVVFTQITDTTGNVAPTLTAVTEAGITGAGVITTPGTTAVTGVKEVDTITVSIQPVNAGTLTVTVDRAGVSTPVQVQVGATDTTSTVATRIANALNANTTINAHWTATTSSNTVILTSNATGALTPATTITITG